jgi:hypothetical protein
MTLRELRIYDAGQSKVGKEAWRQRITIGHMIAALSREKKLPKLRDLLPKSDKPAPASHVRGMIATLARPGEVTYGKKKK